MVPNSEINASFACPASKLSDELPSSHEALLHLWLHASGRLQCLRRYKSAQALLLLIESVQYRSVPCQEVRRRNVPRRPGGPPCPDGRGVPRPPDEARRGERPPGPPPSTSPVAPPRPPARALDHDALDLVEGVRVTGLTVMRSIPAPASPAAPCPMPSGSPEGCGCVAGWWKVLAI